MINYQTAKAPLKQQNTSINSEIMAVKLVNKNLLLKSYVPHFLTLQNYPKYPMLFKERETMDK